ncbi:MULTISPECIES: phosphatase PAP2 family protein [unclassified Lacinutrix]|uniref:phosphatase PAP2 family protein n=1 Tax=unclassified Lacinutrix TaxID=2647285 RepID=UPI00020A3855|nr:MULTISPECIES: phosphatase PAP2 family protein [unclassified Lacinutrix]AEG99997.1 phosphoesterase PA-phosphatase related protein [Lacinutrix sp. 5H-3-7-4]OIQ22747.1 MAG: phosphatase PAP2 family protein [Lacinutrix sp. MedPE-SW]
MLEQLVELDKELFLYLNNLGNVYWDAFWMFYTAKFHWIPFYAILLYLLYKRLNSKMFILTLILVVFMITFTDQVTNLFKYGVARFRPCHDPSINTMMRIVKEGCGGRFGYFSGHSSNSMAVAIFTGLILRERYKYFIYIMIVWAILMGYSRIYIGVHFPLDVLSGFIFGGLSGFAFYKLDRYLQKRFIYTKNAQ